MITALIILSIYAYCRTRLKEKFARAHNHSLTFIERRKAQ